MDDGRSTSGVIVDADHLEAEGVLGATPASESAIKGPQHAPAVDYVALPETLRYRLKNRLLGPPLATERQTVERLGKPTALAVLSSDVISSSAYATEQMLIPLIGAVGAAAFSLVMPVTFAVIAVLCFVTLSYLEVVKVYTKAGGAYVVARENFGLTVAQVAAVSLLIDYTLTVAVSVAAGVAALTSIFPALTSATTWIAVALVILIAYANLRGIREAGRVFAFPTYFFIANMIVLMAVGAVKAANGSLVAHSLHQPDAVPIGNGTSALLYGASIFVVLKAFASGGSALTGTEAISNGVSVFRPPEARNARITMVCMAVILGTLVLGVSGLATAVHPVPRLTGTPTVVAQIAKYVYGTGALGHALFVLLNVGTMLILVLAANTSFTGFPFLASFAADDSYLPRQLTRRGHRLVFSSGIIVLTVVAVVLLIITRARVDQLIPLYAIGVFTGFTMAGAGMAKYHLRVREPHWRRRLAINGTAAVLSAIVDVIIIVTKFTEGAWTIVIILPVGVLALVRLHRQYAAEDAQLEEGAALACEARILRRHAVVVLVDRLDLATARALQYARTLMPDDLRAVHFAVDSEQAAVLEAEWGRLGLSRVPLDVVECPDRRLVRATLELAAEQVADRETELTVLLPRRGFAAGWSRLLHDRTADRIADVVSQVPHANATIVPFQLAPGKHRAAIRNLVRSVTTAQRRRAVSPAKPPPPRPDRPVRSPQAGAVSTAVALGAVATGPRADGTTPIAELQWRRRARVAGRVHSVRVRPGLGAPSLECILVDDSGGSVLIVFQGRRQVPGVQPGATLTAEGMVGERDRRLAILNPSYELLKGRDAGGG